MGSALSSVKVVAAEAYAAADGTARFPTELPSSLLDRVVTGSGLNGPDRIGRQITLRDQLAKDRPTLLIFLRDFGCIFCREMIKDVRIAAETADASEGGARHYPRIVFIHQASPKSGERFFGRYWPGAPAISDPQRTLYDAVGLGRGSLLQLLGPRVWLAGLRALLKRHTPGLRRDGDPWTMPGLLLVDPADEGPAQVRWSHQFSHAADSPSFDALASA